MICKDCMHKVLWKVCFNMHTPKCVSCEYNRNNIPLLFCDIPMHKPIPDWRKNKKKSYFDRQEGGNHYDNKYDVAKFCIGNGYGCAESAIIKYAARHERKNGAEDIKKIIHYAQFILEVKYGQRPE